MSINSKMTALADEIRELSGTSGALGLDAMTNKISEANEEIVNQSESLASALAALEGKAAGGVVVLPELSTPATADEIFLNKEVINSSGEVITGAFTIDSEITEQQSLIS